MIIENVLHFYKKGLSSWNLVFRYMKKTVIFFLILNFLSIVGLIYLIAVSNFNFIVLVFWGLALILSIYFLISRPAKRVIKSEYGISINKKVVAVFKTKDWEIFRLELLKTFLSNSTINNKIAIDELKRILTDRAENQAKNYTPLINTGITLALFIPVWSAANAQIFKSINDFNTGVAILALVLFLIVIINMNIVNLKFFANEFSFFIQEQTRINSLVYSLNIISYEILLLESNSLKPSNKFQENILEKVIEDYQEKYCPNNEKKLEVTSSKIGEESVLGI